MQTAQHQPTHFHSFIIKGVTNTKTDQQGWRVVGLWGDEDKSEGNRIGPTFHILTNSLLIWLYHTYK